MNKCIAYSAICLSVGVLAFWGFASNSLAAEKILTADRSTEYKSCTFSIKVDEPRDYTGYIIRSDGKKYEGVKSAGELYVTMIDPEKKNNNIPMAVICALLAVLAGIVYVLLGKLNKEKKSKRFSKRQIVNFVSYGVWALACIYVFFVALQFCVASSGSMEPTIVTGERYVINRLAYKVRAVETGDIISFNRIDPDFGLKERYTKRVVGVGGDEITFKDGYVFINGEQLDESEYLDEDVETNCMKTFNVPAGYVFVLGDNREYSNDSRYWDDPYVPLSEINGKYLFSIPFTR